MCRRVTCPDCKRPTYAGCGAHIEQVLGDVPKEKRCQCHEKSAGSQGRSETKAPSWLQRILSS